MNLNKTIAIFGSSFASMMVVVVLIIFVSIVLVVAFPFVVMQLAVGTANEGVHELIAFFQTDEDYKALFNKMTSKDTEGNLYLEWYFPLAEGDGYDYQLTDSFGSRRTYGGERSHEGEDIMSNEGTPIVAVEEGEISNIGWSNTGGWRIGISSEFGNRYWFYGHMRKVHPYVQGLKMGSKIYSGQIIGYIGSTGYSPAIPNGTMPPNSNAVDGNFEPHLHIQVSQHDEWLNPYPILKLLEHNKVGVEPSLLLKDDLQSILNSKEERLVMEQVGELSEFDFIKKIGNESIGLHKEYDIFPSISISQACLESNFGKSGLAQQGNNLYGIKAGSSWDGATITMNTKEYINNQWITVSAIFRAYPSWKASILDHAKFLNNNPRYSKVLSSKTYQKQAHELQNAGYATDPIYANKLINMINGRELYIYDKE